MKTILVSGGAGFLGSHLCEKLVAEGHSVLCLDNLQTGRVENISHLLSHPSFRFINADVSVPMLVGVDAIYNLACPASPKQYQSDPVRTIQTCVQGAICMLELAKACSAPILQASTSEIYGEPAVHPQVESYWGNVNTLGPRSCYDEGKRCAESLFYNYNKQYGVKTKIARIFNTYGPRMSLDDGRVVSTFIQQALSGGPVTIFGDGTQTRSFCYVDDTVEALMRLMDTPDAFNGPVNVGNPRESTVNELATMVMAQVGITAPIEYHPLPKDDPTRRRPDVTMAKQHLQWEPSTPFEVGIARTIRHFVRRYFPDTEYPRKPVGIG